jgi:hypothetical protein
MTSIKEIGELCDGDPIPRLRAVVEAAYPAKSGSNAYGDYSIQAAILNDGTGKIRAGFFDPQANLLSLKGSEVEIVSGKNGKGQFSGITVYDHPDKKTGRVTRQIKVSGDATIDEIVGSNPRPDGNGKPKPDKDVRPKGQMPTFEDEKVKRRSIERQQALEQAVLFMNRAGQNADEVVRVAEKFYSFISAAPVKTEPAKQEAPSDGEDSSVI